MSDKFDNTGLKSIKAHKKIADDIINELDREIVENHSEPRDMKKDDVKKSVGYGSEKKPTAFQVESSTDVDLSKLNAKKDKGKDDGGLNRTGCLISAAVFIAAFIFLFSGHSDKSKPVTKPPTQTVSQQTTKKPDTKITSPAQTVPKPDRPTQIRYDEPPAYASRALTLTELQWIVREEIRLDEYKKRVNNYSSRSVSEYNQMVNNFNSRASHFKYRKGEWVQAQRNVEPHRDEIVKEVQEDLKRRKW